MQTEAEKLIEALEGLSVEECASPQDFVKRRQELNKKVGAWGAAHPEEFLPLLNDENAGVIGKWICASRAKGASLLRQLIFNSGSSQRTAALRAYWEFEEGAASQIETLTQLLSDSDTMIRSHAAQSIGRIGREAASAGPELARLARDGGDEEAGPAFYSLYAVGYERSMLAQICYEAIQSRTGRAQHYAMYALSQLEVDPTPVVESVLRVIEESDGRNLDSAAIDLIAKSNLGSEELRQRAIHALESVAIKNPPGIKDTLSTLWRIDSGNSVVMAKVEEGLRSDGVDLEISCDLIFGMKEAGARFVPLLIEQLEKQSDYWDFCWAAVDALGEMGTEAKAAIPILKRLKKHPSDLVKVRVAEALKKIG